MDNATNLSFRNSLEWQGYFTSSTTAWMQHNSILGNLAPLSKILQLYTID